MSDLKRTRIIGSIMRTELASLFGSPIAWFILVVFAAMTCSSFMKNLVSAVSLADLSQSELSITARLFLGDAGILDSIVQNIYIYIPLLTMGLIARETSSGSIKLAYSSPVTSTQLVTGKFLAAAVMGLCLMAIPALTIAGSAYFIQNMDLAPVLIGLVGLYLQILASCAIGLFFSSLTTYQVVAAVGTLATLAVLGRVGRMGRYYDVLRDIAHWLSINGRTSSFLNGVFRTDDFFYFVAIILLFLGLTVMRISFPRLSLRPVQKWSAAAALSATVAAIALISSRPAFTGIYDVTRERSRSITDASKEVVRQMDGKITVNTYINLLDKQATQYILTTAIPRSIFEQYKLTKPDIEEHTVYYYADCASIHGNAKLEGMSLEEIRDYYCTIYTLNPRMFRSPEEMSGVEAVRNEGNTFVREISYQGKTSVLRDFSDDMRQPSEAEVTAALAKLMDRPQLIGFARGNGERSLSGTSLEDYSDFTVTTDMRFALINQGFDITYTSFDEEIPENIGILIVADPSQEFTENQTENFKAYLKRGGNMLFLTDHVHQTVSAPLLRELGIKASERQIARKDDNFSASLVLAREAKGAGSIDSCFKGLASGAGRVTMPGCMALETLENGNGFVARPLLTSPADSWLERDFDGFKDDMVECDEAAGETLGTYVTAYALERENQRILVLGDADCLSNAEMTIRREGFEASNYKLITKGFQWISGGRFPIQIDRIPSKDTTMRISSDDIIAIKVGYIFGIPALILALAIFVLMRRRRA